MSRADAVSCPVAIPSLPVERFEGLRLRFLPQPLRRFDLSAVHVVLPRHAHVPAIYHAHTDELVLVLKGRAWAQLGARRRLLKPGDWLPIPARLPHRFLPITGAVEALSLFSPELDPKRPDVVSVPEGR